MASTSKSIDNLIATRIVHLLITPVEQWDAAKLGIIDKDGNSLRPPVGNEEDKFNLLHVLVLKLKEIYDKAPVSNKMIKAWNAGEYFLKKKIAATAFTSFNVANKALLPGTAANYAKMDEDTTVAATNTASVANPEGPATIDNKYKRRNLQTTQLIRRKSFKEWVSEDYDKSTK